MTLVASAVAFGLVGSAGATAIGFDDALGGNLHGIYEDDGRSFAPNSGTNGNCAVTADSPCLKELTQGEITTMTKTDGGLFDLLGFDFVLVGSGNNNNNQNNTSSMIVTGHFDPAVSFEIKLGDALGTFTNYILTTVTGVSTGNVTLNEGYRVSLLNGCLMASARLISGPSRPSCVRLAGKRSVWPEPRVATLWRGSTISSFQIR